MLLKGASRCDFFADAARNADRRVIVIEGRPIHPDWRDASSYGYTRDFTRQAWAWEFLRRNRAYAAAAANAPKST
jgi:hypothetical protein